MLFQGVAQDPEGGDPSVVDVRGDLELWQARGRAQPHQEDLQESRPLPVKLCELTIYSLITIHEDIDDFYNCAWSRNLLRMKIEIS